MLEGRRKNSQMSKKRNKKLYNQDGREFWKRGIYSPVEMREIRQCKRKKEREPVKGNRLKMKKKGDYLWRNNSKGHGRRRKLKGKTLNGR